MTIFLVAFLQGRLFGNTAGSCLKILYLLLMFINIDSLAASLFPNKGITQILIHLVLETRLKLMILSRPLEHLPNQSTPRRPQGFNHSCFAFCSKLFVDGCYAIRTMHISDVSLPAKSFQIPLSPRDIFLRSHLITATGIPACDI